MEDVWEDAPEGAEFFSRRLQNYYKIVDGVLFWLKDGPGRRVGGGVERSRYHVGHPILGVLEPRPIADEWIEHHGSNNPPVHPDTLIVYKMRLDHEKGREPAIINGPAGDVRWDHRGHPGDIVAYKVVKKP